MTLQIHPKQQGLLGAVGVPVAHHLIIHSGTLGIAIPIDHATATNRHIFIRCRGPGSPRIDIGLAQQQIVIVEPNLLLELPALVELVGQLITGGDLGIAVAIVIRLAQVGGGINLAT